jgi:Co/Zn/Cd efflux system component|tara:strand:+ start:16693 stop:16800 length:108 start_codon:yes stop_codon:yes gene_type:complete
MSAGHAHGRSASERATWIAFALTGGFMLAEVANVC